MSIFIHGDLISTIEFGGKLLNKEFYFILLFKTHNKLHKYHRELFFHPAV